jgi:hypothetical protein
VLFSVNLKAKQVVREQGIGAFIIGQIRNFKDEFFATKSTSCSANVFFPANNPLPIKNIPQLASKVKIKRTFITKTVEKDIDPTFN